MPGPRLAPEEMLMHRKVLEQCLEALVPWSERRCFVSTPSEQDHLEHLEHLEYVYEYIVSTSGMNFFTTTNG